MTLVVYDIDETRAQLISRGVEVSQVFHDVGGVFHHAGREGGAHDKTRPAGSPLCVVGLVQRPGRKQLALPGDQDAAAGAVIPVGVGCPPSP
jgi:hypothetical protein